VSATAVAAVTPRRRTTVCGEVISVASYERRWVRTDAKLSDGTGTLLLRFVGRVSVPGIVTGCRIVADGTPALVHGALVMINPLYSFTADG